MVLQIEPTFFGCPMTLLSARLSGAKSWLHIQDFEVDVAFQLTDFSSPRLRSWAHRMETRLMSKFSRVSTISTRMVEKLCSKGVPSSRAILFPNWVDTMAIHPLSEPSYLRQKLGIPTDTTVALYSGNMGLKQGLHMLIEVSHRLATRKDIYFVICGDGPYRRELMTMTRHSHNVRFLPLQPAAALNDLLNLADIHLVPQLAGAADLVMPSKLTGIMASGRPVLATADEGSQIATVLEGRGLITPSGNSEAFAEALTFLAANPELRRKLGEAARKYAVAHLNRDEILLEFEHMIKKLCSDSFVNDENGLAA
jgi:colanic acid biosynthesis glycosyl transferase WcaI